MPLADVMNPVTACIQRLYLKLRRHVADECAGNAVVEFVQVPEEVDQVVYQMADMLENMEPEEIYQAAEREVRI